MVGSGWRRSKQCRPFGWVLGRQARLSAWVLGHEGELGRGGELGHKREQLGRAFRAEFWAPQRRHERARETTASTDWAVPCLGQASRGSEQSGSGGIRVFFRLDFEFFLARDFRV
ncbi:hypothetical protein CRG98_032456 [Punica granatum]|uniref:Uncharacterized protein n=1 Tax=Punica granatum TaxID=22663 RepID=A0A2I0IT10_PUNGR|nr:hypothetical protein CRG98_032456 [Punica granatum]